MSREAAADNSLGRKPQEAFHAPKLRRSERTIERQIPRMNGRNCPCGVDGLSSIEHGEKGDYRQNGFEVQRRPSA